MRILLKSLFRICFTAGAVLAAVLLIVWIAVKSQDLVVPPSGLSAQLEKHVETLSIDIVNRNWNNPAQLDKAAAYIRAQWEEMGLSVEEQPFIAGGKTYRNVITRFPAQSSSSKGKIIVGAHYDVAHDMPGADDNASGTAGLIELARLLKDKPLSRDIELVAYTLEEPPNFGTENMGSYVHAESEKKKGAKIDLMVSIEMIGYYSDAPGSQDFPLPILNLFYPSKGNFIGVVDKLSSRHATRVKRAMRRATDLPIHSINGPEALQGINYSDHLNYWHFGYDAVMVTDTSFYRNKAYHTKEDTADRLDYDNMAKVVMAVEYFITR